MKNDMKKIAKLMTVLAIAAFTFTSCEDVPNPFGTVTPPTTDADDGNTELPYNSVNLNSGWTLEAITADQPWSQGSSYVQATGYQKWDGAESKTNRAVKGWLVSPAFSTKGYENVKIFFEQTIKYTSYTGWEANHKVFVTSNYDESNFSATTWVEITDFKPVASPYESKDWTLYSSGELQLPASMTGQEAIHIGFYFEAPADKSTTWELKNFNIVEGIADNPGGGDTPTPTGDTDGSEAKPYTIADAVAAGSGTEKYVKAYIVGWVEGQVLSEGAHFNGNATSNTNILIADSPDETDVTKCMPVQLPTGAVRNAVNLKDNPDNYKKEVLLNGNIEKYFGATGIKGTGYAKIGDKEAGTKPGGGGGGDTPSGDEGSIDAPKTVAQALTAIEALAEGAKSTAKYFVKGKVAKITTDAAKIGTDYKDINFYISEDGTETNALYIYRGKNLNNTDFTSADQLAVGDEVIIYGQLQKYKNNTTGAISPQMAQGSYLVKTSNPNASSSGGGSGTGGGGEAVTSLTNGGFETWAEGIPTGWKSASTASSATLEQSTDAHTGNYAVLVKGGGTQNKRLASQEITLTAGTYIFSFWVKATTTNKAQCCMGYVPVTNGTAGTYQYKKEGTSTVYETLSTTWSQVTYEFTLEADATICLVAMNPKAGSYSSGEDILVDDATLTKK